MSTSESPGHVASPSGVVTSVLGCQRHVLPSDKLVGLVWTFRALGLGFGENAIYKLNGVLHVSSSTQLVKVWESRRNGFNIFVR